MLINKENLEGLFKSYSTAWQQGVQGAQALGELASLFTRFPSSSTSNFYAWLDKVPGFRQWVGDRVFNNVSAQKFEVVNVPYEASVRVSRDDLDDDQYGLLAPNIGALGAAWPQKQRDLLIAVLTGNATGWDGKALCADDHAYGGNTVDNLVTSALSVTTFEAAFLAASGWKYADGTLVRPRFTHLLVGEKLRAIAWNIVKNTKTYDGTDKVQIDNVNLGRVELVVLPELAGDYDDYWFLVDCSRPIKPLALQVRREPAPMMDLDPATVQRTGFVDFLADGRCAAAPTFFDMVYGGIL